MFIDDYSRMNWVCFLNKGLRYSRHFTSIKNWWKLKTIVRFRLSITPSTLLPNSINYEKRSTLQTYILAFVPHKNGVSERKNRTIMEMIEIHD
jgi:hypothetical protein